MWLIVLNVAGTLAPEPWPALAAVTGIEELKTTTSSVSDYDSLMQIRAKAMRQHDVKIRKLFTTLQGIEPLPGAQEFLSWLKPIVPRTFMITDGFEEYAKPVFEKLGHPSVFCNFLEADSEGFMTRHVVRLHDQKRRSIEEFRRLNFRIIAVGHSFNDISMLQTAEQGILMNASEQVTSAHPEIASVHSFDELKDTILETLKSGPTQGSKKRKNSDS